MNPIIYQMKKNLSTILPEIILFLKPNLFVYAMIAQVSAGRGRGQPAPSCRFGPHPLLAGHAHRPGNSPWKFGGKAKPVSGFQPQAGPSSARPNKSGSRPASASPPLSPGRQGFRHPGEKCRQGPLSRQSRRREQLPVLCRGYLRDATKQFLK
jgi:hypothetical protein